jgi:hypothetical protein
LSYQARPVQASARFPAAHDNAVTKAAQDLPEIDMYASVSLDLPGAGVAWMASAASLTSTRQASNVHMGL